MDRAEIERIDDDGIGSWDRHDPDAFASMFAVSFTLEDWTVQQPIRDRDGVRAYVQAWMTAFPDLSLKRIDRVIDGNTVAGEITFTGTNSGPMQMGGMKMPPRTRPCRGGEPTSRASTTRARSWSSARTRTPRA